MNEPKKRGRPSKAEIQARAEDLTAEAMGGITAEDFDRPIYSSQSSEFARRKAQAYARKVWDGQSPNLSRDERLGRVRRALESQGMSMEGIEL